MNEIIKFALALFCIAVFFAFCYLEDYGSRLTILGKYVIYDIDANKKQKTKKVLVQELTEKGASEEEVTRFCYHQKYELIFAVLAIACGVIGIGMVMYSII